ncbi:uncharacterized protein si:ch211-106e7.2 [Brienomyrus brachyistius]|uniref:uncharacterized protein si:ch211-106e7.2 n=1 Tax=Brienomyrus brachyistius TaxID=42636 RepID=UPI0020B233EA|nr:uncharacterized protein si:ch211-106e7.2 [Brienomyrus brachyistius]
MRRSDSQTGAGCPIGDIYDCRPSHLSESGFQSGQQNFSPMQASSWNASGWNNPPLGQEQTPYMYQNVFNGGGANGTPYTYVGQHQSRSQTRPVSQLIGNVNNGSHWLHQVLQVPTAPTTDPQANFRGTASSLASRNQPVFDGRRCTISNNGVQWGPSSWNSTNNNSIVPNLTESSVAGQNNSLHPVSVNPAFHQLNYRPLERVCDRRQGSANSFSHYPTQQAAGNFYTRVIAPVNHCSANGGNELVNNGQRNGPISTTVGSAMTQSANVNYPVADMNNGVNVVQEVISAQRITNCGKEASPVYEAVTGGHGQGPPAVGSSVVQSSNANCQPSNVVTSRMNTQGSHSNGSTVAFNLVSAFQNRLDFLLRTIYGQERMTSGKSSTEQVGARVTNEKIPTVPDLPPLTMNTNSTFANGNSDSNSIGNSNIPHVQPSSGPYDTRQSHQNLPSNSGGGIVPHGFTYIQQQSDASPTVCLPPAPAPQQQKSISNNSQGSGALRENVSHIHQNQELPRERLCQNKARVPYALGQVNGQWSQAVTNTEPVHSLCTTTHAPSTFAADPHNLKRSHSWPSDQVVQPRGQLPSGANADPPAYQQRKEYCPSVVEDRQRNHFTAEKKLPPSYAVTMERNQMLRGKTTEVDSSKHSGRCNYQNSSVDRSKCLNTDTSSPGCVRQLEHTKKQHNLSTALVGMKAVAVVPPISQQSSTDQTIGIANKDKDGKIQKTLPSESVGGNPESEPNNLGLSHNVKESTPTISSPGKSLCNVIPTVLETSDTVKAQLSIEQSAVVAETSAFSVGSCEPQPNANKDKELPTKDAFDLSTVPVILWTVDKLRELIVELEKDSTPPESKMEESPTPHILKMFWVGCEQHLYNALDANVEETIFDTWRTCTEDENPVIFSEVVSAYSAKLAETCLVLGPDVYIPNDPVCKPLSQNPCERTDNVDKHHVNPISPEVRVTERDNWRMKPGEMEKCRVEEAGADTLNVELLQKQPQTEKLCPVVEASDPLSLLQIKVLSPTEARELCLFGSQPSEKDTIENPETKVPKGSHDNESAVESYCCLSRWMEVTVGYEASSLCKCRVNSLKEEQEVHELASKERKMEEGVSTTTYLEKHCFPQAEPNCSPVCQTELMASEPPIQSDVTSNECAVTSSVIQNSLNSNVDALEVTKESRPEFRKGDDVRAEGPDEHAVEESILELKTKLSAAADSGLKVEQVNCNFEDVLVAPVVASEELCSKRLSEQKKCGSESSKPTKDVIFGEVGAILKESTLEGMQLVDLQAMLTGTVSHSLKQRIFSRKKKKLSGRNKMQKSKSKLPFQKPLPQSLKIVQKETPSSLPIASIKTNVDCSHNNQQKTPNGTNKHKKDTLNVAKLHFSTCSKSKQASENKAKILRTERFQSTPVSSKGSIASLALYGSSPQKQKYMVVSSAQPDLKPRTSTTTGPPTTISLKLPSQKKSLLEEDKVQGTAARQRVYCSWKRSLVQQQIDLKSKVRPTENSKDKGSHKLAKKRKASSEMARIREGASSSRASSHKKASPVTPKKCDEYGKNTSMTCTQSVYSVSKAVQMKDPGMLKSGMVQNKCQPSKKDEQLLCSNGKKRKISQKGGPIRTSKKPRKSISSNSVGKSKYEMGNPALMPISMKEKVLEFKLLPTSFKFREPQETSVMKKPSKELPDSASPQRVEQTRTLKTETWKLKSHWRYGPNKKDPAISDAASRKVGQSHLAYEEYKKRYLAKALK